LFLWNVLCFLYQLQWKGLFLGWRSFQEMKLLELRWNFPSLFADWQVEHVKISQCHYSIDQGIVTFQCSLHFCWQEHISLPNKSCPPSSASTGAVPHYWHNGILAGFLSKDHTCAHLLVLGWTCVGATPSPPVGLHRLSWGDLHFYFLTVSYITRNNPKVHLHISRSQVCIYNSCNVGNCALDGQFFTWQGFLS